MMPIEIIKKKSTGSYIFRIKSTNGMVVAESEPYASKAAVFYGVSIVCRICRDYSLEDIHKIQIKEK